MCDKFHPIPILVVKSEPVFQAQIIFVVIALP